MGDIQELQKWLSEIDDAKKRDKDYIKDGKRIREIYACADAKKVPFNILFSNTDTLIPALYSAQPRPSIHQRFKDDDPISQAGAIASTRMLEYLIDTNIDGYESFNDGMKSAVIDSLLPGRAITCIKYDAKIGEYNEKKVEAQISNSKGGDRIGGIPENSEKNQSWEEAQGQGEQGEKGELRKESELVCIDSKPWDMVLFGFARKWVDVPWVAFEEHIDKKEAKKLFGDEIANKIVFTTNNDLSDDDSRQMDDEKQGLRKTATIYQIWDKAGGRNVHYVSRHYMDGVLKTEDDPLNLSGFFPFPRPMSFVEQTNDLRPIAPYKVYENQAKELNEITVRINRLVKAIKAKGIYDAGLGDDISNLMQGDDNMLIPADKSSALAAENGFHNAIWFMPIEQMMNVLGELYKSREACKQVIYEVTGISDIIRGSSVASETATAQSIKSQWGTMRLKRNQAEVSRYARDLMRIMLEIAASNFSVETWAKMTGLNYATDQQIQQAQAIMQMAQQYMAQQPQSTDEQGNPQQPQIPEQYQQIYSQAQQMLQSPSWTQVLSILRDDITRAYKIDIETNSTIMPEASEDQRNMAEAMAAMSQVLSEIAPLVQSGAMPFQAQQALLLSIIRRYQFGDELEGYIKQMQHPQPPQQPQEPVDNTLQIKQMDIQAKQQSEQMELSEKQRAEQVNLQVEAQKLEAQRIVEQGKAATLMRIEEMRIEADKEIKAMELAFQKDIKLAEMSIKSNIEANENSQIVELAQALRESFKMQREHNNEVIDVITSPKKIIIGADGMAEESLQ